MRRDEKIKLIRGLLNGTASIEEIENAQGNVAFIQNATQPGIYFNIDTGAQANAEQVEKLDREGKALVITVPNTKDFEELKIAIKNLR